MASEPKAYSMPLLTAWLKSFHAFPGPPTPPLEDVYDLDNSSRTCDTLHVMSCTSGSRNTVVTLDSSIAHPISPNMSIIEGLWDALQQSYSEEIHYLALLWNYGLSGDSW
ncbi:hypothetical protein AVEN_246610-1 [Araneus ventricosus]|uniref:Uncharacterized protein n=1 Tax=Araneus ventricosus TaxID=182803 RepID=A0A4Y2DCD8_ARAVE|nr:hypothetical protein AVEN_246610-1 [Araneus ventricosus]